VIGDRIAGEPAAEMASANRQLSMRHVELVVQSLQTRLGPAIDADLIRTEVEAGFAAYSEARVRDFVPILVETGVWSRFVRSPRAASPPTTDPSSDVNR
jgi:hypothetical protein